jgi:hypothetical protein
MNASQVHSEISRDHLAEQLSGWIEAVCMDLIHAPTPRGGPPNENGVAHQAL